MFGPKDGDAMINDAGKRRVKDEEKVAAGSQNVAGRPQAAGSERSSPLVFGAI